MMTALELAGRIGLRKYPRDWRGTCPACAYAGTFVVKAGRDGMALPRCENCRDRTGIAAALQRMDGSDWTPPEPQDPQTDIEARARRQASAQRCWSGAEAVPGTLAERYLRNRRVGFLAGCTRLRFRQDVSHPQGGRLPAMVALVTNADDEAIGCHRTYLATATGLKADVEPAKASLGPIWGGAVRLAYHRPDLPLVIGEGIESSGSAGLLMDAPAWAAINAGNLAAGLELPRDVRHVIIAADPDEPGERAAEQAAGRWRQEGKRVEIVIPNGDGDFNDVLMRETPYGR